LPKLLSNIKWLTFWGHNVAYVPAGVGFVDFVILTFDHFLLTKFSVRGTSWVQHTRILQLRNEAGPPLIRLWRHITGVVNTTDDEC